METDTRRRALFLAPEAPYPLTGGGAFRSASLLQYLARTRDVDLIVFREPGAPDPRRALPGGLVRDVLVLDLPFHGRGSMARAWRNTLRMARRVPPLVDRFAGFADAVAGFAAGKRYEVGVIEHFWCAPYLDAIAPRCERTVLDLHNVESVLHGRCAAIETGARALGHRVFRAASIELERRWLPRFSRVLAPSAADAERVRELAPGTQVSVYPNAIPCAPRPPRTDELAVVFSGNLEYQPNISAVRFFRREVWPLLRERWPGLVWRLVGKNPEAIGRYAARDQRIEVTGAVDDAVRELARARVAVVPLLAGSGTRVKILEAWAAGTPVVSTRLGAEGLPASDGEHLLLAEGGAAFAEAVSRLLASEDLREALRRAGTALLEKEFTWEAVWANLDI